MCLRVFVPENAKPLIIVVKIRGQCHFMIIIEVKSLLRYPGDPEEHSFGEEGENLAQEAS